MANSAWLSSVGKSKFARVLDGYSQMGLERILSTHLPAGEGACESLIERLGALAVIVAEAKGTGSF